MTFLKKFFIPLMLFLALLYIIASVIKSNEVAKEKEEVRIQQQLEVEQNALNAIKRFNANYRWIGKFQNLSAMRRLFSSDLESEWITSQPIFFPGYIKDILTKDDENYLVKMKYLKLAYPLRSIGVDLVCKKSMVDGFIASNPISRSPTDVGVGVAAIAVIASIDVDGGLVGKGSCIELIRDVGLEDYKIIKIE